MRFRGGKYPKNYQYKIILKATSCNWPKSALCVRLKTIARVAFRLIVFWLRKKFSFPMVQVFVYEKKIIWVHSLTRFRETRKLKKKFKKNVLVLSFVIRQVVSIFLCFAFDKIPACKGNVSNCWAFITMMGVIFLSLKHCNWVGEREYPGCIFKTFEEYQNMTVSRSNGLVLICTTWRWVQIPDALKLSKLYLTLLIIPKRNWFKKLGRLGLRFESVSDRIVASALQRG